MIEDTLHKLAPGMVAVLGVPLDENSSFLRGPALAPPRIRETLHSSSGNWTTERGTDLSAVDRWLDLGDLSLGHGAQAFAQIEETIGRLLAREARVLTLGGDHSITYPILRAYARAYPRLTIFHVDAHPDLYDELDGNRWSHACPFARIMEEGLAARLVQVGIRTINAHQRAQAERFGVEVIEMRHWQRDTDFSLDGPIYLSLDLDALDPAFAPGVSHHEPGGFSTREIIDILHRLPGPIVGADLVEYNPTRDLVDMTAMVAAKFYKEIVGRLLEA